MKNKEVTFLGKLDLWKRYRREEIGLYLIMMIFGGDGVLFMVLGGMDRG
ncbi:MULTISPECIES: hypothetical protein [Pelosinus]|nr:MULTISPECIES: hypothetical protein [Pelosinus]